MTSCDQQEPKKVVFFGDSITQAGDEDPTGYIQLMRQELDSSEYELIGAGVSGDKVPDLLARVENIVKLNPDIVVVYIGINDVWHFYEFEGEVGTELDQYEEGLRDIANAFRTEKRQVILCTPSVIGENPEDGTEINEQLDQYAQAVVRVAAKTGSELCDLRSDFKDYLRENNTKNAEEGILTTDGVHMNKEGNEFLARQMIECLVRLE
ncbi:MAG: SGNH/GDSL hydrolase family protein [Cyclobacteriaceae bacterium]